MADVVLVHGLWYRAWSMRVLAGRLSADGWLCRTFSYPTRKRTFAENASSLAEFCRGLRAEELHFVAHSLGGLLVLEMLRNEPGVATRRIALLGTPLHGSGVAARSTRIPGGKFLLGLAGEALVAGAGIIPPGCETGMVSGTRPHGLGRVTGGLQGPSDGTVSVAETVAEGLADRIELPVTHTGMLVSFQVARQCSHFLTHGRFEHD